MVCSSSCFAWSTRPGSRRQTAPTPGSPVRALPTLLFLPKRSEGDDERFPLVVFSPGYGSVPEDYESLLEQWASAGYVVAAVEFPVVLRVCPRWDLAHRREGPTRRCEFVIEKLIDLDHTRGDPVTNLLDTSRVAVAGHSLGGVTTLALTANTCCRSLGRLIKAAVVLSAYDYQFDGSGTYFPTDGYHPPTLEVSGTADTTSPLVDTEATYCGRTGTEIPGPDARSTPRRFRQAMGPGDRPHRCGIPQ